MVSHSSTDSETRASPKAAPGTTPSGRMALLIAGAAQLGIELDSVQAGQFESHLRQMLAWNARAGLTRVTDPDEVQARHFVDSLSITACLPGDSLGPGASLIDVGSGAGLPGVPLKIAFPSASLELLEANGKKAAFLQELVGALGLEDAGVVQARAEDAGRRHDLREEFDLVVSRAVAPLEVLVELTLPFCRVGGVVVAQKGEDVSAELDRASKGIELLGGGNTRVCTITPPGSPVARSLVVIDKVSATPGRFPRRPGIPAKRPL